MNKDEWISLSTIIVALIGPQALKYGVTTSDLMNALTALFSVAMVVWTLYKNWNMRKVAETAVVTSVAPTVAVAKAESIPAGK
jgi:hypothetical protein